MSTDLNQIHRTDTPLQYLENYHRKWLALKNEPTTGNINNNFENNQARQLFLDDCKHQLYQLDVAITMLKEQDRLRSKLRMCKLEKYKDNIYYFHVFFTNEVEDITVHSDEYPHKVFYTTKVTAIVENSEGSLVLVDFKEIQFINP
ncbi:MAG: hypothetical protein V4538_01670 [Bacteroidota bacterium]